MLKLDKVGRNDPCPCGSGKKYKKCCMAKDEAKKIALSHLADMLQEPNSDESQKNSQLSGRVAEVVNLFNRGCNQLDKGDYEQASKSFISVLKLDTEHYEALTGLGRCFIEMGRREEARRCFEKALKINPDYAQARLNLDFMS